MPFTLPRQTWYSWVEYFPGQVVSYQGLPFLALKASTGITPPSNGIPSNEWQPIGYDSRVALMLSGHTHGGQVRLPLLGAMDLPTMGRKYVEGLFQLQNMQLYVNRGIGTVGLPFRLNCPPEITSITLRRA